MIRSTDAVQRAFSETSDPRAYVPRPAVEALRRALARWREEGRQGASVATLIAPPGLGKTFLLRLFESELSLDPNGPRGLYLPYAGLPLADLSIWVHGLLGCRPGVPSPDPAGPGEAAAALEAADAADPGDPPADPDRAGIEALLALGGTADVPFTLIVDDAESMSLETARTFARRLPAAGSALRLLLAVGDDARAMRLRAVLEDLAPCELVLREPMGEAETRAYLRGRMGWAGVDEATIGEIESQSASRIHALSGGVPRAIHRLAGALLEGRDRRLGEPRHQTRDSWRGEEWLGRPIEEDD